MSIDDVGEKALIAAAGEAGKLSADRVFSAIGGFFPFHGLKRKAVETYVAEIQASDLSPENKLMAIANTRITYKQMKNQTDIALIAHDSAKNGTDFSQTNVDDEWLDRFMDASKYVSDSAMKLVWGKILAGEFEEPGSINPRVIRLLTEITPKYAKIFTNLCNLSIKLYLFKNKSTVAECYNNQFVYIGHEYIKTLGINFVTLNELENLGLIMFDADSYFMTLNNDYQQNILLVYGNQKRTIKELHSNRFPIGSVMLTETGECLRRYVETSFIEEHFQRAIDLIQSYGNSYESYSPGLVLSDT